MPQKGVTKPTFWNTNDRLKMQNLLQESLEHVKFKYLIKSNKLH